MHYTLTHKSQSWLWWLCPDYGTTIGNTIYMPDKFFTMPEPDRTAWLKHEETHIEQRLSWCRYLTSRAYRRECELQAYEMQVRYLTAHGRTPRVEEWARVMSDGYSVLKWIERREAETLLREWIRT